MPKKPIVTVMNSTDWLPIAYICAAVAPGPRLLRTICRTVDAASAKKPTIGAAAASSNVGLWCLAAVAASKLTCGGYFLGAGPLSAGLSPGLSAGFSPGLAPPIFFSASNSASDSKRASTT